MQNSRTAFRFIYLLLHCIRSRPRQYSILKIQLNTSGLITSDLVFQKIIFSLRLEFNVLQLHPLHFLSIEFLHLSQNIIRFF